MLLLSNLNLNNNQILNVVIQVLAMAPSNPSEGQIYYNSVDKRLYIYNGSAWKGLDSIDAVESINRGNSNINMSKIDGLSAALVLKESTEGAQLKANKALEDSKEFTKEEIKKLVNNSPEELDTLKELADSIKNNKNLNDVVSQALTKKTGKYSAYIGDNIAKEFTVEHNMNSKDIIVQIQEKNSPYSVVYTDVDITNENSITVKFATAPGEQQYKVVVIG